jgi:hypothetical protein
LSKYDELLDRNKYDDLLDAPRTALRQSVRGVIDRDPDQSAQVVGLAERTGLPVPLVQRNREQVERREELTKYDRLLDESPEVARFLSEPANAEIARDDVSSLSGLEWLFKAPRAAHREQWKTIELGTLRAQQMQRDLTPEENARVTQLKGEITGSQFGAEDWYEKVLVETGRMLPTIEAGVSAGATGGALTGLGFGGAAALLGQAGPQAALPEELLTVPGAAAGGFLVGSASAVAKQAYDLEAGLAFDEFLDMGDADGNGVDPQVAAAAASLVGVVNAGLESFGLATLLKRVPGVNRLIGGAGRDAVKAALQKATFRDALKKFGVGYAATVGTEVTTEVMQEAATILGGEVTARMSAGEFKGLTADQIGARLADIAVRTTQGVALIGGAGPGAQLVRDSQRARAAQQSQAVFEALGQHSTDSKLRQRLPAKFQEYVKQLREGGEVADVRIPVEQFATYFQTAGLDPAEVAREVTGSDAAYTEAQAAGTDLVIPLDAYAAKLAPTDHHAALMPDLRLRPDDMTMREAEQWQESADALTKELGELAPTGAAARPVYEDVLGQLLQSGLEQGAAEQNAQLMASVFETLGSRTGVDPMELYQRYGLRVQNEVPEVLKNLSNIDVNIDPLIDRLRAGQVPTDREIYGPSLTEFLRERGGLQDQGGELASRDVQKTLRGFVKPKGLTFDAAVELAQEAGYLPEGSTQNELLAAIDRELGGQGAFKPTAQNQQLLDLRTALDDLGQFLSQQGVDVGQADNAAIRTLLQQQQTLEQSKVDTDFPLSAVHNLTAANLKFADDLGGIAVPSMAIVPESQTMRNYGEITLIGTKEHGDPENQPTFDADAYTATFPSPEYPKVRQAKAQKVVNELKPYAERFGERSLVDEVWDNAVNRPRPAETIRQMTRPEEVAVAWFLGETGGEQFDPVMEDYKPDRFSFAGMPAFKKYVEAGGSLDPAYGSDEHRAFSEAAREAHEEYLATQGDGDGADVTEIRQMLRESFAEQAFTDEGLFAFGAIWRVVETYKKLGTQVVDRPATRERMNELLKGREAEFQAWATDKIMSMYGDPFLKVGGKRKPYTLDSIVEHMTRGRANAKEETLTYGEGKARAAAATKFTELEWMRNVARESIKPEKDIEAAREAAKALMEEYRSEVIKHYDYPADTWNALDASMRAVAGWAKGRMRQGSKAAMRSALSKEGFKRVPDDVLDLAIEAGDAFLAAPVPYFESKPQRAVEIKEFAGAVIPDTASDETKAILEKNGVPFRMYPTGEGIDREDSRAEATIKFRRELSEAGVETLFQSANPQTLTPEFRTWFGASTVVDENGKPQVVYHGTADSFDSFDLEHPNRKDTGWLGTGVYATTNPQTASSYSNLKGGRAAPNVMPLYARLENPYHATQRDKERLHLISHNKGAEAGRAAADEWTAELKAKGHDGVILEYRASEVGESNAGREIVVFDPAGVKSATGNRGTFDPKSSNILEQTFEEARRGSIQFGPNRQFNINLLKDRDLSTFLHESGHFYLEVLGDLASANDAPEQIVQDYASILKWFGVETRQAIEVKHHEQFARGFEAYLMEGKAPNVELQNAFARFRAWLTSIYKQLKALNVTLTEEVRGVFDRLVATDDAITGAEEAQNYVALFATAEEAGMSPEQFAAYTGTVRAARIQAEDDLSRKLLAVMTREQKAWWKEQRAKVLEETTAEVHGMRVYRALAFLQTGKNPDGTDVEGVTPTKLSKAHLLKHGYPAEFLKRLPGAGKTKVYAAEGGTHPDVVAALFGYRGTDELVQELVNARPMKTLIAAETDARMKERYPDPLVDGSLAESAIQAVHSTKRAELLAAELRALKRKAREVATFVRAAQQTAARERTQAREANAAQLPDRDELKLIRAAAQRTIGNKRVRDISPGTYRAAEAKASRAAFSLAAKGDYQRAYFEKRKQLLNHELFEAAEAAREESDAIREYFKRFGKKSVRERIGKAQDGALEKIEALLADFSLVRLSGAAVDRLPRLRAVLDMVREGELVAEAPLLKLLEQQSVKNWRELSFDDLAGLRDVIKQLEHQAVELSNAIVNGEKVVIQDAAKAVADSILAGNKAVPVTVGTRGPGDAAAKGAKSALNAWLRPAEIARQLDGGVDFGATLRTIIEPIRRAYAEKLIPMEKKVREDVAALYRKAYSNEELSALNRRDTVPELGLSMTRGDLISLALNWGNEGNRQALLESTVEGHRLYTEQGVAGALTKLTAKDWEFVQSVWDYIDTYWPQLAALEKRRRGVAPKKVEASTFTVTTADGQRVSVRGGYYPLKYDAELNAMQRADDVEDAFKKLTQGRYASASTRAGATIERVGSGGRPVRLGLGVIDQHLHEVARDIALGDESRFVMRILNRPEIRAAMVKTGNLDALDTLKLWLQDAAVGEMAARGFLSKASAWTRVGFTKAKLAWNLTTTLLQVTGLPQTLAVVGPKAFASGFGQYLANPVRAHRHIMESSAFMRARYETNSWNKDVSDTKAYLESYFGGVPTKTKTIVNALSYSYFWPIARVQMLVDGITWMSGYAKGVTERKLSDADAVKYADSTVENAQTSGFFVDRSAIERGSLDAIQQRQSQFVKLWTTLISYMLAKGNITYAKGRQLARKPTLWGATALAGDLVLLYAVEAVLAGLIRGQFPDDDDEESVAGWIATESLASAASGVPFVREIANAKYGSGNTPLGGLATDFYKAFEQTSQGEVDPAMIKAFNNVGGTLFHYPAGQINKAVDAYWADAEGEDVAPYEYLTGRKRD